MPTSTEDPERQRENHRTTGSPRRAELLARTLEYTARTNISDLSLRPLAAAIGSSPRVLIYLFGSKEGLIREVLAASRAQQLAVVQAAMNEAAAPGDVLTRLFSWMCDPEHRGLARLFFECFTRSVDGGEPWSTFALDSVRDWQPALRQILPADASEARVTLTLSVLRGLLLDLLATGEVERVAEAWQAFAGTLETAAGP